jgi:hypothetical protein
MKRVAKARIMVARRRSGVREGYMARFYESTM